jgi:hypothetical protein
LTKHVLERRDEQRWAEPPPIYDSNRLDVRQSRFAKPTQTEA